MKKHFIYAAVSIMFVLGFTSSLFAQFNAEISIGDRGLRSFYLSVGNYYHVPQREVIVIHERQVPHDEIPVVFYIAQRACVSPRDVAALRLRGSSWMEITMHYGLGPDIYGRRVVKGPRGKAWGYHKKHNHISDYEIIDYCNARVMSHTYGCSNDDVYRMRKQGYDYVKINDRFYSERNGRGRNRHDHGNYDNHRDREVKVKVKEKHVHKHGKWDRD